MSSKIIAKKIFALERKRKMIVEKLISANFMIRGSFSQTTKKCGKSNCWCINGNGHPTTRITWNEHGQPRTKTISKKEIPWVSDASKSYKNFRLLRHEIKLQENELNELLNVFEKMVIQETKKKKKIEW